MGNEKRGQEVLFDLRNNPYVQVVEDLSLRECPNAVKIKSLDDGNYRVAIVDEGRVVQSLGIVPQQDIYKVADLHREFTIGDDGKSNLYVQLYKPRDNPLSKRR